LEKLGNAPAYVVDTGQIDRKRSLWLMNCRRRPGMCCCGMQTQAKLFATVTTTD
jgi:hypothetical protein